MSKSLQELVEDAQKQIYGETESEDLVSFLLCEAFESRYDQERRAAFILASQIVKESYLADEVNKAHYERGFIKGSDVTVELSKEHPNEPLTGIKVFINWMRGGSK